MAAEHETAYPRFKIPLTAKEINALFTPTEEEYLLIQEKTNRFSQMPRLGFTLLLKGYQYLGRPIKTNHLPAPVKQHVADFLNLSQKIELKNYDRWTSKNHLKAIRDYLNVNANKSCQRNCMKKAAINAAQTKENIADIINCMIEVLLQSRCELPSFATLHRIAMAARKTINYGYYHRIDNALPNDKKTLILTILGENQPKENENTLSWSTIKKPIKKPTTHNVRHYLRFIEQLKTLKDTLGVDIQFIPPSRLSNLKDEALIMDTADMKKLMPSKKYALVIILIHLKLASAIDELVTALIQWTRKFHHDAEEKLEQHRLNYASDVDELVLLLYNMLNGIKQNKETEQKLAAVEDCINGKTEEHLKQCKDYLKFTQRNYLELMLKPYSNKRYTIYQILELLSIKSSSTDKTIETALAFMIKNKSNRQEWLNLTEKQSSEEIGLAVLSERWHVMATGKKKKEKVEKIHLRYYELGVLSALATDLSCADAYIENSDYYDDPNKQQISWEVFHHEINAHCQLLNLPKSASEFRVTREKKLSQIASEVDHNFLNNDYFLIEKGKPFVKKSIKQQEPESLATLRKLIMDKMPITNIVDVIVDVENWLGLSTNFKPRSGFESKIIDYPSRFASTAFSYGCNVGPTQTERCLQRHSRKQIARLFNHHISEEKVDSVIAKLINQYNLFTLPKKWGDGSSASVDGTFWDMYKQNLLAAHHIRYGKYGGVGYYHVSDMYIALFSNFISCGVHEAAYLLDGIVENDSDIQPTKIHGDSWAQSEVLFALGFLLGIDIMPRIKNFKNLHFYKANSKLTYEYIDAIFTEKSIDWELIETHYWDMLRVALSIKLGTIKASTILRKLCAKSRKNKLYYAFRELGRVQRTIFLLSYVNDVECRKIIHAATCKSEEFNQFIDWVAFGGDGVIHDNLERNQRKVIKFNHLVANMVIFHNVVHQTKAINELISDGVEISDEVLRFISPFWTEHLNRFGTFVLNMDKKPAEIDYLIKS